LDTQQRTNTTDCPWRINQQHALNKMGFSELKKNCCSILKKFQEFISQHLIFKWLNFSYSLKQTKWFLKWISLRFVLIGWIDNLCNSIFKVHFSYNQKCWLGCFFWKSKTYLSFAFPWSPIPPPQKKLFQFSITINLWLKSFLLWSSIVN